MRGQTNFVKMLWKFNSVYNPRLQLADHARPVQYELPLPPEPQEKIDPRSLYIHGHSGRPVREIDRRTEEFVQKS